MSEYQLFSELHFEFNRRESNSGKDFFSMFVSNWY